MRKRWTTKELDEVRRLIEAGDTFVEIAKKLSRTTESVSKKMHKLGWKSEYNKPLQWTENELEVALEIVDDGGSYKDVASALSKSHHSVDTFLSKRNIKSGYRNKKGITKYALYDWNKIQKAHSEGLSYKGLKEKFSLTPQAFKWAQSNDKLIMRSASEGLKLYYKRNRSVSRSKGIKRYRQLCEFKFNVFDYPDKFRLGLIEEYGWYKASNRGDNPEGVSRDHMVSVSYGFENGILPFYISHPANCRLMQHSANNIKNTSCSISFEELLDKIEGW